MPGGKNIKILWFHTGIMKNERATRRGRQKTAKKKKFKVRAEQWKICPSSDIFIFAVSSVDAPS